VPEFTDDDDALLSELGVEVETDKPASRTPREERIIAGFEDIQRFVDEHGRSPRHGEERDIFERLYAVRLDRLRELPDCRALLEPLDRQGLLTPDGKAPDDDIDDDALLAELGVGDAGEEQDVTTLRFVRSGAEKRAADEIANREKCRDFDRFRPLFEGVQADLDAGQRQSRLFRDDARIAVGDWFILQGQKAFVAAEGEEFTSDYGRKDRRLRVIFDNATEASMLKRSLERALQKDEAGRRITEPDAGPLFAGDSDEDDLASGTVYVLRSKSDDPQLAPYRELLHKIGVTGGDVQQRIANARLDATFLLADVEIVATYRLFNISRSRLESLIHKVFGSARLDVTIPDRFGNPVQPREWFLVPLFVIEQAIDHIRDGTITQYRYDPATAKLAPV
jgi:hypothetical protein